MKYSFAWIKDYVSIRTPLEKLSDRLTMAGLEVISIDRKGGDTVFEIEVTPNRPDLLSHIGTAREIAALTGEKLRMPRVGRPPSPKGNPPTIKIDDKKGCLRYTGRLFEAVQVGPSPSWLKARLEGLGVRPVNNIVDITNFVLLEWGQPLHAFDYDQMAGGTLIVRAAKKGERILTLDGENRELQEGQLIIADSERPIGLAGVMGGKATEISGGTRRILLESAFFDPVRIRKSSRASGLATESSYRFERGVSWEGVLEASDRAAALFSEIAQAKPCGRLVDVGRRPFAPKGISLHVPRLREILGVSIPATRAASLLKALGCQTSQKGSALRVLPPSFRRDLQQEEDLIEEVARLFGYNKIPFSVPSQPRQPLAKTPPVEHPSRGFASKARTLLVSQGLFEVMTYSLLSRPLHSPFLSGKSPIVIRNPLSLEQEQMRSSLLPRMVEVAAHNLRHKAESVPIFELGAVYERDTKGAYRERQGLGILLTGQTPFDWQAKSRPYDYFDLKGICELVCRAFGLEAISREGSYPFLAPEGAITLLLGNGAHAGYYGELSKSVRDALDLAAPVYVAELDMAVLVQASQSLRRYVVIPRHPIVTRDVSFIIPQTFSTEELQEVIQESGGDLLRRVFLFDEYVDQSHKAIPKGSRSLAYRMEFLHPERTLTQQEVDQAMQSILQALTGLGGQIRG